MLPKGGADFQKKRLPIDFVNADGVISQGGLSKQVLNDVKAALLRVKSMDAKASKAEDERQIHSFIEQSTTHEQLDLTLKEITKLGLDSATGYVYFFWDVFVSFSFFWDGKIL